MNNSLQLRIALVAAVLTLAGCGGGGGGGDNLPVAEDATVPAAALTSAETFSRWVANRPASDTGDPLSLLEAMPPTSESDEPIEVN